jgi:hypothetical protein
MVLTAFDEDVDDNGSRDDLMASGTVERSPGALRLGRYGFLKTEVKLSSERSEFAGALLERSECDIAIGPYNIQSTLFQSSIFCAIAVREDMER